MTDGEYRVSHHQSCCLSISESVCLCVSCFAVTFVWYFSHFKIKKGSNNISHALCFSLLVPFYLFEDFMTNWDLPWLWFFWKKDDKAQKGGHTFSSNSDAIKWLSVCPFDCPAGHWESTTTTASHTTWWHRFSAPSHYLGRYAQGEDESLVFLQLPFFLSAFSALSFFITLH